MWLLSTDSARLRSFNGPEHVPGGYAILSHVWDEKEDSYQKLQAASLCYHTIGETPRDHVSTKLRMFCILAEKHGHHWAWADTSCINKESSAELTEGINSMFRYYTCAQVCYVYLKDVPQGDDVWDEDSSFRRSRWHTRGWTLQELIAPELVVFLSMDWEVIGTKAELAPLISQITQIPITVLTFEKDIADLSIAQRMSWAAGRTTTRQEDEAYCLLGIFSITMPTLYGEGRRAFYRLQEEIMKVSSDTSLLVWGREVSMEDLARLPPTAYHPQQNHDALHLSQSTYLLAESPFVFSWYKNIERDQAEAEGRVLSQRVGGRSLSFQATSTLILSFFTDSSPR